MDKASLGVEAFLDYLREAGERHRMAEADRAEADAATQDILHALELGQHGRTDRARLALKLREVRRQRRRAKDTLARTGPVAAWARENQKTVKDLERLLGEVRKAERQTANRAYAPRTRVLDELGGKEGPS